MTGKIIKNISNLYTVLVGDKTYVCKPRGKFRNDNIKPVVGDEVVITEDTIMEVLPRKNELKRPVVSNVDYAIIVASATDPSFSPNLIDKLLVLINYNNIKPIIFISKIDLLSEYEEINKYIEYYKSLGILVFTYKEIKEFKEVFKDNVLVLTGQSGAGKSTLLNKLDTELNIETNIISKALGRGKHTTRHVELYHLFGGLIADTPGFSSLSLKDLSKEDIRDQFNEFEYYKEQCKYRDCFHIKEDSCFVKKQVESGKILKTRHENYVKFVNEE